MACSGQVYGLNGSVLLATKRDEDYFFSHDLIRTAPRTDAVRLRFSYEAVDKRRNRLRNTPHSWDGLWLTRFGRSFGPFPAALGSPT